MPSLARPGFNRTPPVAHRAARHACIVRLLLGALVTGIAMPDARADAPFTRPIRIIVPVAAGGSTDLVARLVAESLRESIGQPVVVENRPGATGRIAVEVFKRAAPDGSTFMLAPMAVSVLGPLVFRDAGYDPSKDFVPVAQVSRYAMAMAVRPDHPARTLPEFVAWAQAHPREASYGTGGSGSLPHLLGVLVGRATGAQLTHVAYRSVSQAEAELMGGQTAAAIGAIGDFLSLERGGKVRVIATSGAERSERLPSVRTFAEQGIPTAVAVGWNAVYALPGTPRQSIDQLSTAIAKALRTAGMRAKFGEIGLEPTGTTPDELAGIIAADIARWAPIVKAAGFAAEPR